jgi:hypothetical protein
MAVRSGNLAETELVRQLPYNRRLDESAPLQHRNFYVTQRGDARDLSGHGFSVNAYALRGCKLEARLRSGSRRQGLCALRSTG